MKLCALIPAKDERLGIGRTLSSILAAGLDPADVYVVDDGSNDGSGDISHSFGVNVLCNEKNIGKASSIARGTEHFGLLEHYDIIALMDADTEVCKEYYTAVKESFKDPSVVAVCGRPQSVPYNYRYLQATGLVQRHYRRGYGLHYSNAQTQYGEDHLSRKGDGLHARPKVSAGLHQANEPLVYRGVAGREETPHVHRREQG